VLLHEMNDQAFVAIVLLIGGCTLNVWTLEVLAVRDPGCGALLTFAQFVYVAAESFVRYA